MVNRRKTSKRGTRKRGTRKRGTRNNVGGIPVRKFAWAALAAAAAAAMYGATRGAPHNPGRGHTSTASGNKRRTKKGARKTRGKKGRGKSKRR